MNTLITSSTIVVLLSLMFSGVHAQDHAASIKAPRIQPLPMSQMQESWLKTLEKLPGAGLKGLYSPVNVFGTLQHNPDTYGSFLEYWVTSKLKMGLTPREQELVILRMGYHYKCNYVWKHHVPVGKESGITDAELDAVKTKPLPAIFSPRESALLHLTDEMVESRNVSDETWIKYSKELKDSEKIDLISLVSQYVFFALLNNVIQVEVEQPLVAIPGL
jgi:4-carboxymuconolactone decarboxylase